MLHDLIEKYPLINYVLFVMANFQVIFFLYIGMDLLRQPEDKNQIKEESEDETSKLKTQ